MVLAIHNLSHNLVAAVDILDYSLPVVGMTAHHILHLERENGHSDLVVDIDYKGLTFWVYLLMTRKTESRPIDLEIDVEEICVQRCKVLYLGGYIVFAYA